MKRLVIWFDYHGSYRVIISMALLCFMLFFTAGFICVIYPKWRQYQVMQFAETNLCREFEQKQAKAIQLAAYQKQLTDLEKTFNQRMHAFAQHSGIAKRFDDISKLGVDAHLVFESFTPDVEVTQDFYKELVIKITISGHYRQLAVFLSQLAHNSEVVVTSDLSIRRANSVELDSTPLMMTVLAKLYIRP